MKLEKKIFIMANNVHQGGGRALLLSLLASFDQDVKVIALLDSRIKVSGASFQNINLKFIRPSIWARFRSEWWLYRTAKKSDIIFCFGNLPPIFPSNGDVTVFLQNRHLIEPTNLSNFPFKSILRIKLERIWLSMFSKHVIRFIVQTPSMKASLKTFLNTNVKIDIHSFIDNVFDYNQRPAIKSSINKEYDFVYIASGEPHKNHYRLLEAWELLASEGIYPSLCLTIDKHKFESLYKFISDKKEHSKIKVCNLGEVSSAEVERLYLCSSAMIFPSLLESFGLPLVEAVVQGVPILASELDYVRDLMDPVEVFNPTSALSISRSVKRFLKKDENRLSILSSKDFARMVSRFRK